MKEGALMAIHENKPKSEFKDIGAAASASTQNMFNQPTAGNATANAAQPNQPQFNQNQVTRGLMNTLRNVYTMSRNAANAVVSEYLKVIKEIASNDMGLQRLQTTDWGLLPFDGTELQASMSGMIFVRVVDKYVAYYPIFLESTAIELQERVLSNPAIGQFNVPQYPEELWTSSSVLSGVVRNYVQSQFIGKEVIEVGGIIIPAILDIKNVEQLRSVLYYASEGVETTLFTLGHIQADVLNLANKDGDNEALVERINFYDNTSDATATGMPVRTDVEVTLDLENRRAGSWDIGSNNRRKISAARGYIAFNYNGSPAPFNPVVAAMYQNGFGGMNPAMMANKAPFDPQFIIRKLENLVDGAPIEVELASLASAAALARNNAWAAALRPNLQISTAGADRRDIGALTVLVNDGERGITPTKTDSNFNLADYLQRMVTPDLFFFVDVPEMGELSHVQRLFIASAGEAGEPGSKKALAEKQNADLIIINGCNNLTNGNFSRHWDGSEPMFISTGNRVELGYYQNEKNELRDIHEVDGLFLANCVADNGETAIRYMESFNPNTGDQNYRFYQRLQIYRAYVPTFKITGFARRLQINSKFLVALSNAIYEACGGFEVKQNYEVNQQIDRGHQMNYALALSSQAISGAFRNAYGAYGANGNNGMQYGRTYRATNTYGGYAQGVNYNGQFIDANTGMAFAQPVGVGTPNNGY